MLRHQHPLGLFKSLRVCADGNENVEMSNLEKKNNNSPYLILDLINHVAPEV